MVCMDIGASADLHRLCLENNAKLIYAIDVGTSQLDVSLLMNNRVKKFRKYNFRYLEFDRIGEKIDFVSIDVSFISLNYIFID